VKIRDSQHALGRIVVHVTTVAAEWSPAEVKPRLETLR
jgi:hypothetical protein